MVQWLGLSTSTAGGLGLIPSWGTKVQQVALTQSKKKRKEKKKLSFDPLVPSHCHPTSFSYTHRLVERVINIISIKV